MSDIPLQPGDRVRILSGVNAGEKGEVERLMRTPDESGESVLVFVKFAGGRGAFYPDSYLKRVREEEKRGKE